MFKGNPDELLIQHLQDIKQDVREFRKELKDLRSHFDVRHDNAIKTIDKNKEDIATLKVKQVIIALIAGMSGGHFQDILKSTIF